MLGIYLKTAGLEWKKWCGESAILLVVGLGTAIFSDFTPPWWAYTSILTWGAFRAGYTAWKREHVALKAIRDWFDAPGLQFVDGNNRPPFNDVVGPRNRPTFRIGIENTSGYTRRNVRVRVIAINGRADVSQIPALLRSMDGDQPAAIDIQNGQPGFFEVAKIVVNRNSLMLCRWRTPELPELPHGSYRMLLQATADDMPAIQAEIEISSTQESIEGRIIRSGREPLAFQLPGGRPRDDAAQGNVAPDIARSPPAVRSDVTDVTAPLSLASLTMGVGKSSTVVTQPFSVPHMSAAGTVAAQDATTAGDASPAGFGFFVNDGVFSIVDPSAPYRGASGIGPVSVTTAASTIADAGLIVPPGVDELISRLQAEARHRANSAGGATDDEKSQISPAGRTGADT